MGPSMQAYLGMAPGGLHSMHLGLHSPPPQRKSRCCKGQVARKVPTISGPKWSYTLLCLTVAPGRRPKFTRETYTALARVGLLRNSMLGGWAQQPSLTMTPMQQKQARANAIPRMNVRGV
jgi:hypothetical protein